MVLSPNNPDYTGVPENTGGSGGSVTSNEFSALEVRVSTISSMGGGAGSVTSNELSAVSAQAASAVNVVSNALSNEISNRASAVNVVSNAASNAASIANAVSQAHSALSQANSADHVSIRNLVSIVSTAASNALSVANAASNAASNALSVANAASNAASIVSTAASNALSVANAASNHASAASAAATSVDSRVTSVNTFLSGISARSVGNVSTHGLQSVIDALSNRISATAGGSGSVTSNEVSAVSAQAASAINVVSNAASNALSVANAASNAASVVSNDLSAYKSTVSAVSARSVGDVSTHGLQSIIDALSNRISAGGGGGGSVTSTELSAVSAQAASAINVVSNKLSIVSALNGAGTSVVGLQTVVDTLSDRIARDTSAVSTIYPQKQTLSQIQTVSSGVLVGISGLSFSTSAFGVYYVDGYLLHTHSAAAAVLGLGWSTTGAVRAAGGEFFGAVSYLAAGGSTWLSTQRMHGQFNETGMGSIVYSATPALSGTTYWTRFNAVFAMSAASANGVIQLVARAAGGTGAAHFLAGSFMRALKVGGI